MSCFGVAIALLVLSIVIGVLGSILGLFVMLPLSFIGAVIGLFLRLLFPVAVVVGIIYLIVRVINE
jgi:hypothetical protein